MRYPTVRNHLKPYVMVSRRKTTINHAFAAAIAPSDDYDVQRVRQALALLGQDPDQDLRCAYCGATAQTWDHVFATVKDSRFSGYGHRLGNLLPCCKFCNSAILQKAIKIGENSSQKLNCPHPHGSRQRAKFLPTSPSSPHWTRCRKCQRNTKDFCRSEMMYWLFSQKLIKLPSLFESEQLMFDPKQTSR